jgi:hypothetical protein
MEIPKIKRYTGKALLKRKIQKTGNPKTGRKNIKWHIFYTPGRSKVSCIFENMFRYNLKNLIPTFKFLCPCMILIIPGWKDGVFILTKINYFFHAII